MLREVGRRTSTLHLETWGSWLFGELWSNRAKVPPDFPVGWELALGRPIADRFAAIGGPHARTALETLARLDRGEFGAYAFELACGLREHELPEQFHEVCRAPVVKAFASSDEGDGEVIFLETRERHTVAAFIDEGLGGIAKRLHLVHNLDTWEHGPARPGRPGPPPDLRSVAVGPACRRLREAMLLTDLYLAPPVPAEYARMRALAFSRACSVA